MSDSRGDPSFFRRAPSPVSEVGDWTQSGPLIGQNSRDTGLWLAENTQELSRASAVITKQENWQIQWEFHRETRWDGC